jgi:hypothetical protein
MKQPISANDNVASLTRTLWESRAPHELSAEDVRQIIANVSGFFTVLAQWSSSAQNPPANNDVPKH